MKKNKIQKLRHELKQLNKVKKIKLKKIYKEPILIPYIKKEKKEYFEEEENNYILEKL